MYRVRVFVPAAHALITNLHSNVCALIIATLNNSSSRGKKGKGGQPLPWVGRMFKCFSMKTLIFAIHWRGNGFPVFS